MILSSGYNSKKKVMAYIIGIVTLLLGGLLTIYIFKRIFFIPAIFLVAYSIITFCMFFPYLHRMGYFRRPKINYDYYDNPEKRFPARF